jgi:protein phosphatase
MALRLRVAEQAFRTDTGRQRTANEDSYFASAPLFAVADGMGGAQAGEVASRIAAESFEPAERSGESPEAYLRSIALTANQRIHSLAEHDSSRSGMGTTLTAALVEGGSVSFAHVGDSRAYLFRDGELRLLTTDHSLVEELRRQGRLTPEQAEDHPQRSIITRALGPEAEVEVDTLSFSARPDDVFLLCSDGLTTMIKDEQIAEVLGSSESLADAVAQLVREANEAGGRDNITVVAFRLEETDEVAVEESPTLIGPSAEAAGLTGERVRAAAASREPVAAVGPGGGKSSRGRRLLKVAAVLLVLAALAIGAWLGARQIYFLGVDEGGRVALYRGLPYDLPLDISLYDEVYSVALQAESVPEDRRESVTDHELRSRDDAVSLLDDIEASAAAAQAEDIEPDPANGGNAGDGGNANAGAAGGANGDNAGRRDDRQGSAGDGTGDGSAQGSRPGGNSRDQGN